MTSAVINRVLKEHHDGALDVGDGPPVVDLPRADPQHVAGLQGVLGEVDGVGSGPALYVHQQVEVETLRSQELVVSAAPADAVEGVHLDVADTGRGR